MKDKILLSHGLTINFSKHLVLWDNAEIPLAKKEIEIVELLAGNLGQIFNKEQIYEKVWKKHSSGKHSVVSEHIRRIRVKLSNRINQNPIETIWNSGYKWAK